MKSISKIIKGFLPNKLIEFKRKTDLWHYRDRPIEEIFTKIYNENIWGGQNGEFFSGTGTVSKNSEKYIRACISLIKQKAIHSVLDIGCGDFTVMKKVVYETQVNYLGADVVGKLIENNSNQYSNKNVKFLHLDAINDELPIVDLITIRQVLQHLNNNQIQTIINKGLKVSKFLLITEHLPIGKQIKFNIDKHPGPDIRIYKNSGVFLEYPPFSINVLQTILEYDEDVEVYGSIKPAIIRTCLIKGNL